MKTKTIRTDSLKWAVIYTDEKGQDFYIMLTASISTAMRYMSDMKKLNPQNIYSRKRLNKIKNRKLAVKPCT